MKLTKQNYVDIIPKEEQEHIFSLFVDLEELNKKTDKELYIDWQDWHNEYSSERVDPCPDYYGYYTLRFEHLPFDTIGGEMNIDELDNALFILISYEFLKKIDGE